jgi:hypothetical protein
MVIVQGTIFISVHRILENASHNKEMKMMGRSPVFPYPAVQYIPIALKILCRFAAYHERPLLAVDHCFTEIRRQIPDLQDVPEDLSPCGGETLLLGLGLEEADLRYRGYYATMQTKEAKNGFIASIPVKYFYKNPVFFQARDSTGRLLAACRYDVKNKHCF